MAGRSFGTGTRIVRNGAERPVEARGARNGTTGPCGAPDGHSGAFYVSLPYPPSLNHLWRRVGAKTLLSAEGRRYHELVGIAVAKWRHAGDVPPAPHEVTVFVNV